MVLGGKYPFSCIYFTVFFFKLKQKREKQLPHILYTLPQEPIILTNPTGDSGPAKRSYSKDKKHSLCIQE